LGSAIFSGMVKNYRRSVARHHMPPPKCLRARSISGQKLTSGYVAVFTHIINSQLDLCCVCNWLILFQTGRRTR